MNEQPPPPPSPPEYPVPPPDPDPAWPHAGPGTRGWPGPAGSWGQGAPPPGLVYPGFRPVTSKGSVLKTLFAVLAAMYGTVAGALIAERWLLTDPDPAEDAFGWWAMALVISERLFVYALLVGLATFVVLVLWIHRCRCNLDALGEPLPRRTTRAAVIAWFIPPVNLMLGLCLLSALGKGSRFPDAPPTWRDRWDTVMLHIWWWCMVVGWPLVTYGAWKRTELLRADDPSLTEALQVIDISLTGSILLAVACAAAGVTVQTLSKRQDAKAGMPTTGPPWGGPPWGGPPQGPVSYSSGKGRVYRPRAGSVPSR